MFPIQDMNPSRNLPIVTWMIIVANVVIFLVELSLNSVGLRSLVIEFGVIPHDFINNPFAPNEIITLLASMFLHGGWLHLIGNMWALYIFGDNVEDRLGHWPYLAFYLLCGVVSAVTQIYTCPGQIAPTIGASGAIAGVLGGYALLFPNAKVMTLIPIGFIPWFITIPAYFYLGFWFVMQAVPSVLFANTKIFTNGDNIAFGAHVGGFVAGLILVKLCENRDYREWNRDEAYPY